MKHIIKVAKTFIAQVVVEASTFEEANAVVKEHFGCVAPTWQDNNCDQIIAWETSVHPQETQILIPVDAVGIKQEDASYILEQPTPWANTSKLMSRANEAATNADLALLGVELVEIFTVNPSIEILSVSIESSYEITDDGRSYESMEPSVSAKCDDSDEEDTAKQIEYAFTAFINQESVGKGIFDNTENGKFSIDRKDLEPFLGRKRLSGISVMKYLASLPDSDFNDNVAKMEVLYV